MSDYFKKTTASMKKHMLRMMSEINKECTDQKTQTFAISRLDSMLSLLQITHLHIIQQNKQTQCATTEDAVEAAKEATAAKETTLI